MCPYHLCTICVLITTYCDTGCISTLSNTFRFIKGCAVLVTVFRNKTLESVVVLGERERKCFAVSPARHVKCILCPAPSAVCLSWYIEHLFSSASKAKYSTLGERREMQVVSSFLLRVPSRRLEILVRLALRSHTRCCCRTFSLPPITSSIGFWSPSTSSRETPQTRLLPPAGRVVSNSLVSQPPHLRPYSFSTCPPLARR